MANKKNTITRAQALDAVIGWIADGYIPADEQTTAEVAEVLTKMHASITKPRPKSNEPSRAAKENIRLAAEVLKVMPADEPVLTSWIMEHVHGIMTAQKCTKVMAVLLDAGKVERVPKVQGRYTGYKLV